MSQICRKRLNRQFTKKAKEEKILKYWDEHPHLLFAALHYFPNWGKAIEGAGLNYARVRKNV